MKALHVLAVRKAIAREMGGISAWCHVQNRGWGAQETFEFYARDPAHTRVQVVQVDLEGHSEVLCDEIFWGRVDHADEARRVRRLDDPQDVVVWDVRSRRPGGSAQPRQTAGTPRATISISGEVSRDDQQREQVLATVIGLMNRTVL
jgi:hypothetical protein